MNREGTKHGLPSRPRSEALPTRPIPLVVLLLAPACGGEVLVGDRDIDNNTLIGGGGAADGKVSASSTPPVGFVDAVSRDEVYGWAKDPDTPNTPIAIHIYCYPRGGREPIWGIPIVADRYRPDVGHHGYSLRHPRYTELPDGEYEIVVNAIGRDNNGNEDRQNVALPLSLVGMEVDPRRQLIKKDTFAHGQYMVFSQYLGILWDEPDNYDMYQSAVRVADNETVFNYYTRANGDLSGESVYVRTSPNGITGWSDFTRVLDQGRFGTLDSALIADGNVVALPEGDHYRFWLHYTGTAGGEGLENHVFQATTTNLSPYQFVKRTPSGNTFDATPLFSPSRNNDQLEWGAGQPSLLMGADGRWHIYFTDTTVTHPPQPYVIHKVAHDPMGYWQQNDPATYAQDILPEPATTLNSSELTYYPNLRTYAVVKLYNEARIFVGSSPTAFIDDPGHLVFDSDNPRRNYIAEGGLLRGLYGQITTHDNATIAYYGAGEDTGGWSRYGTTGCGATRFYLYELEDAVSEPSCADVPCNETMLCGTSCAYDPGPAKYCRSFDGGPYEWVTPADCGTAEYPTGTTFKCAGDDTWLTGSGVCCANGSWNLVCTCGDHECNSPGARVPGSENCENCPEDCSCNPSLGEACVHGVCEQSCANVPCNETTPCGTSCPYDPGPAKYCRSFNGGPYEWVTPADCGTAEYPTGTTFECAPDSFWPWGTGVCFPDGEWRP